MEFHSLFNMNFELSIYHTFVNYMLIPRIFYLLLLELGACLVKFEVQSGSFHWVLSLRSYVKDTDISELSEVEKIEKIKSQSDENFSKNPVCFFFFHFHSMKTRSPS